MPFLSILQSKPYDADLLLAELDEFIANETIKREVALTESDRDRITLKILRAERLACRVRRGLPLTA